MTEQSIGLEPSKSPASATGAMPADRINATHRIQRFFIKASTYLLLFLIALPESRPGSR
jgi:hypothetical protein